MGLMVHKQSTRTLLFILLLVCAAVFAASALAEQVPDAASYYVFIRGGNEEDFAGSLPSVLNAFGFLHPDYANVTLHIYKVPEFNQRTDNCIELYSGAAGTQESLVQIQASLAGLESTEQSMAGTAAATILEGAKAEGGKVIFVGRFNTDAINGFKSRWTPLVRDMEYVLLNSNQHQISADANSILIRNDDIPGTVMDLYRKMCTNRYDQVIEQQATAENAYGAAIPDNARQIRILAPANTYYIPEEAFYTDQQMTLVTVNTQGSEYKLELEDNGAEKKLCISTVYDPYHLVGVALEESKDSYTMSDTIRVKAAVESRSDQAKFTFVPEEWDISTVLSQEGKEPITVPMIWGESAYVSDISLRDKSGQYSLTVLASSKVHPWISLSSEAGQINVNNKAPSMKKGAEETVQLVIWLDDPLQNEYKTTIPVKDWFTDDGPAEDIAFKMKEKVPWAEIRNGELHILTDQMGEEAAETLHISAVDAAQTTSKKALTLDVSGFSVFKHICEAQTKLTVTGEEGGEFHKDTPVKMEAEFDFPEIMKSYLDLLAEKGKLDQFVGMLKGEFALDDETLDADMEPAEKDGMPMLRFKAISNTVRETGDHTVSFKVLIPERENYAVTSAEKGFIVADRVPTIKAEAYAGTLQKEIPGPLILNKDLPVSESEVRIKLDELMNTEVNDVITVKISGNEEMNLYRTDGEYIFTDAPGEDYEKTDGIVWDTREDAPTLVMRSAKHGEWTADIKVTDNGNNEANGSPLTVSVKNRFHDEDLLIIIALAVICVIVLIILIAILHQILKPAYKENDILQVGINSYSADIPLQGWKKKGFTLREVLIYSGVPVIGDLPVKALDKVELTAGGRKRRLVIRNTKKAGLEVKVKGVLQGSNKVYLVSNEQAEIAMNEQETITLRMLDE